MAENNYFSKYVAFLRKHELYDEYFFSLFWNKAIHADIRDDNYKGRFGSRVPSIDIKRGIMDLVPCIPFIDNDKAVAIAIYAYIYELTQTPIIIKRYNNKYFDYILPMFYERLYILENENTELLEHEKETRNKILNGDSLENKKILQSVDELVESYKKKRMNEIQITKRAKRLARECKRLKKKNT